MLLWSGWHEPGALGSLELYAALQNLAAGRPANARIKAGDAVSGKYQVILGDWSHAGGLDQGIQLQWFDTWMKGIDTGLPKDTETPLHLAELGGTKRWINASAYPLVATYAPLYLSSGGKLTRSADAAAGSDELKWVAPGQTSGFIDYATEPFTDGAMLAGPMAARLEATSSNGNLQLVVDIYDRAPSGTLAKITHGSVLGSLRRVDAEKSWLDDNGVPARPWLTLDENQPLTPGEPTRLDVTLWPSLWSIEPGHSIVVRISTQPVSSDCGDLLGVPVGCNPPAPMRDSLAGGVYTLHRGAELASMVSLPLMVHGALATAESAVSPTGRVTDPVSMALGVVEYPLPIDW
jgi:predicted acyl esterase